LFSSAFAIAAERGRCSIHRNRSQQRYHYDDYAILRASFGKTADILSHELSPEIGRDRVTLSRAWNRASLHGHYKAINHINRAKEAGPEGGTRCSSEDGQVE